MSSVSIRPIKGMLYLVFRENGHQRTRATGLKDNREGRKEAKELVKEKKAGLLKDKLDKLKGNKLNAKIKLDEGVKLYTAYRLLNKKPLSEGAIKELENTVKYFKEVNGDLYVNMIEETHIAKFYANRMRRGNKEATLAKHSRNFHTLFKFFAAKKFVEQNFIQRKEAPKGKPVVIPYNDVKTILDYFKSRTKASNQDVVHQYHFVYATMLTGFRPSTLTIQRWEDTHFEFGYILADNVKGKRHFKFPIHIELEKLLIEMGAKPHGLWFPMYTRNTTPSFWTRHIKDLYDKKLISKRYPLTAFRKSFATLLAKEKKVPAKIIQTLLSHEDDITTKEWYITRDVLEMNNLNDLRDILDTIDWKVETEKHD